MHARIVAPVAALGASALVTAAAVAAMVIQGTPESDSVAGEMSTGVTVTAQAGDGALPAAEPEITGPAPLPEEEQGLPGD